jgi:uncharacterized protein (TIGR02284 family)
MRASNIEHEPPVSQSAKTRISSAFNHCEEAASDLERFLAHAAADAKDRGIHRALYDAAKTVGDLPIALRTTLRSVDAFVEIGGTATGALQRAALEARVAVSGRDDATILESVDHAFQRALSVYDGALEEIVKAPTNFAQILLEQRKTISHLHREIATRWPRAEV